MKFSGRAVYLLGVALFVGEQGGVVDAACTTSGVDPSKQQTFDYNGFEVKATPDAGVLNNVASGFPTGNLLEIRASENGCGDSIEFRVLQNAKKVDGGLITTDDNGISHVNVEWNECTGASCSGDSMCEKSPGDAFEPGTTFPSGSWFSACCVDGWASIKVQFNDGQFQTDPGWETCNDNFSCGGRGKEEKNAQYEFEVKCDAPSPTSKPTASPTTNPTPGPTDATVLEVCDPMDNNGDTVCPGSASSIVKVLNDDGTEIGSDTQHMIWDINFVTDEKISFRVDNPYEQASHIFVQYHSPVGSLGAFDFNCDANLNVPGCDSNADVLTAHCYRGLEKHTRVSLYFVSADPALVETPSAVLPCCAESAEIPSGWKVRKVVLQIECACPTDA